MKCPYCGYTESKVVDSRPTDEGARIRRRREHILSDREEKLLAAAPPLFTGTFVFVAFMVLGLGAMDFSLVRLAAKQKKPLACVLFIVSFLFCLMMGYLSSRDFTQSYMNWAAELVNIVGQGSLLWGVLLYRKGAAGTAG